MSFDEIGGKDKENKEDKKENEKVREREQKNEKEKDNDKRKKSKEINTTPKREKLFMAEREIRRTIGLTFKELYEINIKQIENKTKINRKKIYMLLVISLFFFLLGYYEIIFTYLLTIYFPIKWTIEDYKLKKDDFYKMWGTYWLIFSLFVFFDFNKKEVLKFVPFYFIIRSTLLLFLYLPCFKGAITLYDTQLSDFFKNIDIFINSNKSNGSLLDDIKKNVKFKNN